MKNFKKLCLMVGLMAAVTGIAQAGGLEAPAPGRPKSTPPESLQLLAPETIQRPVSAPPVLKGHLIKQCYPSDIKVVADPDPVTPEGFAKRVFGVGEAWPVPGEIITLTCAVAFVEKGKVDHARRLIEAQKAFNKQLQDEKERQKEILKNYVAQNMPTGEELDNFITAFIDEKLPIPENISRREQRRLKNKRTKLTREYQAILPAYKMVDKAYRVQGQTTDDFSKTTAQYKKREKVIQSYQEVLVSLKNTVGYEVIYKDENCRFFPTGSKHDNVGYLGCPLSKTFIEAKPSMCGASARAARKLGAVGSYTYNETTCHLVPTK